MWNETEQGLHRQFEFADFNQAFSFMEGVAKLAEERQHHPYWSNEWNKVDIWLQTHDAGDSITQKDRDMAAAIDKLAG